MKSTFNLFSDLPSPKTSVVKKEVPIKKIEKALPKEVTPKVKKVLKQIFTEPKIEEEYVEIDLPLTFSDKPKKVEKIEAPKKVVEKIEPITKVKSRKVEEKVLPEIMTILEEKFPSTKKWEIGPVHPGKGYYFIIETEDKWKELSGDKEKTEAFLKKTTKKYTEVFEELKIAFNDVGFTKVYPEVDLGRNNHVIVEIDIIGD